jgi:hypothetical protein
MDRAPTLREDFRNSGYKDKFYIDRTTSDNCYSIIQIVSATETEENFTIGETLIHATTYNLEGSLKKESRLLRLSEHLNDIRVMWDLNIREESDIPS